MNGKTTYSLTKTDGTIITRSSKRVYTHAVIAAGMAYDNGTRDDVAAVVGFCGSFKLAEKLAAAPGWYGVKIVEVVAV
jgi:hypothetical protein